MSDRTYHVLAALKQLQRDIVELGKMINECREAINQLQHPDPATTIRLVLPNSMLQSDSDSDESVASAPATVSYDIE